jgi:energy-coupling factor transporter ATP-binding protein EcfA2
MRINLTTALGLPSSTHSSFFDEPSVGLHSRDIGRLISILQRLRDAGNTLLVVEHDPELIAAADTVIDMGRGWRARRYGGVSGFCICSLERAIPPLLQNTSAVKRTVHSGSTSEGFSGKAGPALICHWSPRE